MVIEMAAEIERKFLVASDAWRARVRRKRVIRQGYIANADAVSVRVRIYDDSSAMLTLKSEREGIRRNEFEYPIPKHDAEQLLLLARGTIIEKTRHELPANGVLWEIDVFKGDNEGLVLAEIELDFMTPTRTCGVAGQSGNKLPQNSRTRRPCSKPRPAKSLKYWRPRQDSNLRPTV